MSLSRTPPDPTEPRWSLTGFVMSPILVAALILGTSACDSPARTAPQERADTAAKGPAEASPEATASDTVEPSHDLRMVLTFDDLPHQGPSATFLAEDRDDLESLHAMNLDLVEALRRADAPAIAFVNEGKLRPSSRSDPAQHRSIRAGKTDLLRLWLEAGFELGNHTANHPSLHRTPVEEYERDILEGERVTRELAEATSMPAPRWFRHPYLHTGRTPEIKKRIADFLREHGYRIAPVTIDNSEWIFSKAYALALAEDLEIARRVRSEYLDYMMAKTDYYERLSVDLLDRRIPQVLLLHVNRLNADSIEELVARHRARGYRFEDLERALEDPAYLLPDGYDGPAGISWLQRWAMAQVDGDERRRLFAGEPTTPAWILELAEIDSE